MTNFENNGNINRVFIKGEVVRKFNMPNLRREKKGLIITIKSGNDYPQVVCFGQCAEILSTYQIGERVFIRGNIQSSKIGEDNKISVSIFCSEVLPSDMVADIRYNRIQIQGRLIKTIACKGKTLLLMKTFVDNHLSTFLVRINEQDFDLCRFMKNQTLFLEGYVHTFRTYQEDKRISATDYVIEKIISL